MDAFGLNIYEQDDQLSPKISFPWGEIRNVEYHGKKVGFELSLNDIVTLVNFILKFCIMPSDKRSPSFVFFVSKTKISDLVSELKSFLCNL